jgi:membrane protein
VVGILSALWSGSFVVIAIQSAFDSVWEIPRAQRPSIGAQIKRGMFTLGAIALGLVASTMISSYVTGAATGTSFGMVARPAGYLIAIGLDVGLFVVALRLLTDRDVSTRDVLPGALLSGIVAAPVAVLADHFPVPAQRREDLRQFRHRHHHVDVVLLAKASSP